MFHPSTETAGDKGRDLAPAQEFLTSFSDKSFDKACPGMLRTVGFHGCYARSSHPAGTTLHFVQQTEIEMEHRAVALWTLQLTAGHGLPCCRLSSVHSRRSKGEE